MQQDLKAWFFDSGWVTFAARPNQSGLPRWPATPRDAIAVGCYLALSALHEAVWTLCDEEGWDR